MQKKLKKRLRISQTLRNLQQIFLLTTLLLIQTRTQEPPHLKPFLKPILPLKRQHLRRKRFQRQYLKPKRKLSLLQMINQEQKLQLLLKSLHLKSLLLKSQLLWP